ncbi:hypothetical protein PR202_gb15329 [Eleusine coracana subsp. coracana]|uniref:Pentatricopeptide repeat-containing protein n=1 Tax=Eleusine coracana subsp. coracana TaxID=191504 RepID=A0AAV5EYS7_ELECO|nr:hypothetical protein PR202_gb15329 [Eleusine coracana subsp. coracana]
MSVRLPGASKPSTAMAAAALSLPPPPCRRPLPSPPPSTSSPIPHPVSLKRLCKEGNLRDALYLLTSGAHGRRRPPREDYGWVLDLVAARRAALEGMQVHAHALATGSLEGDDDGFLATKLVFMYGRCGRVEDARRLFDGMPGRTVFSWNALVGAYLSSGSAGEAVRVYRAMRASAAQGVAPDGCTLASVLKACGAEGDGRCGREVHGLAAKTGLHRSTLVANALIGMYAKCDMLDSALRLFEWLQDGRDVASWNSVITGCVQNGRILEALGLFRAVSLFSELQNANIQPDSVALVSVLVAIAGLSTLTKGKQVHGFIIRRGFPMEGPLVTSLVDMYSGCGSMSYAIRVFDGTKYKDVVLWTAMINATGLHGHGKQAVNLFERMLQTGLVPDHISFLALLHACSHSKLVDKGKYYMDMMRNKYRLEPWQEHYACMVDILGRSGQTEEAYKFIQTMPVEPKSVVWCALLGACRVHKNHELAVGAANKLLELEPDNPGNYILVSNVFAEMGEWNNVSEVRTRMAEQGVEKRSSLHLD